MSNVHVVVNRPFCLKGKRQEVGTVVEVDKTVAAELCACGKAAPAAAPKPVPTVKAAAAPSAAGKKEPQP